MPVRWIVMASFAVLLSCLGALQWLAAPAEAPARELRAPRAPARVLVRGRPVASVAVGELRAPAPALAPAPAPEREGDAASGRTWEGEGAPGRDYVRVRLATLFAERQPGPALRSGELESAVDAALRQYEAQRELLFGLTPDDAARRQALEGRAARAAADLDASLGFAPPNGAVIGVLEREPELERRQAELEQMRRQAEVGRLRLERGWRPGP